jgi:hypothetical protein
MFALHHPDDLPEFQRFSDDQERTIWHVDSLRAESATEWGTAHLARFRVTAQLLQPGESMAMLRPHLNSARASVEAQMRAELTAVSHKDVMLFNTDDFWKRTGYAAEFFNFLQDAMGSLRRDNNSSSKSPTTQDMVKVSNLLAVVAAALAVDNSEVGGVEESDDYEPMSDNEEAT